MKKERVYLNEKNFVGLTGRTSFALEQDPATATLGPLVQQYFKEGFADKIPNRKNPGDTIILYTNYDSNYQGSYLFGIGEEVFDDKTNHWGEQMMIPKGPYLKFTTKPGPMPKVVVDAWKAIWALEEKGDLGGERRYNVDFELYGERAADPLKTVVDIFIGIKD
jgi:predicted transcriptional regulator YdeE